ncbi:MAG TPA: 2-amino-4-hydroxy-6-hydroxymethyldihydropteridine diphosphokinase [Kofleriaceae bacterium]|nr:2-amino-4-hydroxy-6-hydroxymethyldihydropteridine diphosphokinase [Kofleriaceae bacterium]
MKETTLVIGLGGNIGDEDAITGRFDHARAALLELGLTSKSAKLYRTAAIGQPGAASQSDYLNTAVRIHVDEGVTGRQLYMTVREIEILLGRDRRSETRWGPRTIDLDVILWGTRTFQTPELEVPHPRWSERLFVVRPLIDLFGEDAVIHGHRLGALEQQLAAQRVQLVSARW